MRQVALAALLSLISASAAVAAEPYIGSWAAKPSDCRSEPLFIFSTNNLVGATFACKSARYAPSGKGWKVAAKACSTEDGDAADMGLTVVVDAGKLQVLWDDGSKSDKLVKCAK